MALTLDDLDRLTGGKIGTYDVACPFCGPHRRALKNQLRRVMRVWRDEWDFATFYCARCGEGGHARDQSTPAPDPEKLERARAEAAELQRVSVQARIDKARYLWSKRHPIRDTLAETYLRQARGYGGPLPATLGFLPSRGKHGPAMIAAFGLPQEPEPGRLSIATEAITGVHITRLAPDGRGKAGTDADKIMVGCCRGSPIVVAPVNDLCGLAITEGIEDALSVHKAQGLGAWAAGSASSMPALASVIPSYVEALTIIVDDDPAGRRHADELADLVEVREIWVRQIELAAIVRRAA
jgi:hypothetical protein